MQYYKKENQQLSCGWQRWNHTKRIGKSTREGLFIAMEISKESMIWKKVTKEFKRSYVPAGPAPTMTTFVLDRRALLERYNSE